MIPARVLASSLRIIKSAWCVAATCGLVTGVFWVLCFQKHVHLTFKIPSPPMFDLLLGAGCSTLLHLKTNLVLRYIPITNVYVCSQEYLVRCLSHLTCQFLPSSVFPIRSIEIISAIYHEALTLATFQHLSQVDQFQPFAKQKLIIVIMDSVRDPHIVAMPTPSYGPVHRFSFPQHLYRVQCGSSYTNRTGKGFSTVGQAFATTRGARLRFLSEAELCRQLLQPAISTSPDIIDPRIWDGRNSPYISVFDDRREFFEHLSLPIGRQRPASA